MLWKSSFFAALLAAAAVARAQEPVAVEVPPAPQEPTPPPAPVAPPDVVLLTDGSMVRGTIVESVVNDHVIITTVDARALRFDAPGVRWAGPAASMPVARPPQLPPPPSSALAPPPPPRS